ncbi:MAG: hypothetical protein M3N08_02685, partial [Pseudomonadota bacterium]|nr:hypothetical protein [Pseudomonadota bacterium]
PIPKRVRRTDAQKRKIRKAPKKARCKTYIKYKRGNPTIKLIILPGGKFRLKISEMSFKARRTGHGNFSHYDSLRHSSIASVKMPSAIPFKKAVKPSTDIGPFRPSSKSGGWPAAAIIDWTTWGRRNPKAFFIKWPELGS